jgi:hypothetical protein
MILVALLSVIAGPGDLVRGPCPQPTATIVSGLDYPDGRPFPPVRLRLRGRLYGGGTARLSRDHRRVRNLDDDVTIRLRCP